MKMFRNRLLVPLVLIAVLTTVLGASVCSASSYVRMHTSHTSTSSGATLKPGTGPFTGEPDAGSGAPLPKAVPTGAASPVSGDPDSPLWVQMTTIAMMKFWAMFKAIRG
jgi:hypothetical protein